MADIQKEKKSTKITCIVTGKTTQITRDYYDKKIAEFGSEQNLHSKYICKQAKSMLKRGYSLQEVQDVLGKSDVDIQHLQAKINEIISEKDSENFMPEQPLQGLNIDVKPQVRAFINNLKNYNG